MYSGENLTERFGENQTGGRRIGKSFQELAENLEGTPLSEEQKKAFNEKMRERGKQSSANRRRARKKAEEIRFTR